MPTAHREQRPPLERVTHIEEHAEQERIGPRLAGLQEAVKAACGIAANYPQFLTPGKLGPIIVKEDLKNDSTTIRSNEHPGG